MELAPKKKLKYYHRSLDRSALGNMVLADIVKKRLIKAIYECLQQGSYHYLEPIENFRNDFTQFLTNFSASDILELKF